MKQTSFWLVLLAANAGCALFDGVKETIGGAIDPEAGGAAAAQVAVDEGLSAPQAAGIGGAVTALLGWAANYLMTNAKNRRKRGEMWAAIQKLQEEKS